MIVFLLTLPKKHMKKILILLRGLPNSGKTTLAYTLTDEVCEADSYFMVVRDENGEIHRHVYSGEYEFDPKLLKEAHEDCRILCEDFMSWGQELVVVSNTFTEEWEMEPYYKLAKKYDYMVHSIIVEKRHEGENNHNVPKEQIEKMRKRFQIKL